MPALPLAAGHPALPHTGAAPLNFSRRGRIIAPPSRGSSCSSGHKTENAAMGELPQRRLDDDYSYKFQPREGRGVVACEYNEVYTLFQEIMAICGAACKNLHFLTRRLKPEQNLANLEMRYIDRKVMEGEGFLSRSTLQLESSQSRPQLEDGESVLSQSTLKNSRLGKSFAGFKLVVLDDPYKLRPALSEDAVAFTKVALFERKQSCYRWSASEIAITRWKPKASA